MKSLSKEAKDGLVKSLTESAKKMEENGEDASELRKVIKSLGKEADKVDLSNLNADEIKAVKKSVGGLEEGLLEAEDSAKNLASAMATDMAVATGEDEKLFTTIADDAAIAELNSNKANDAAKQFQDTLNNEPPIIPDPFGNITQGIQSATEAFTSFAMGTQMISAGITTAFDENASAVERLMGAMMIL
jgi:hypothetical protein